MQGENTARIQPINLEEELQRSFIAYSMAVIINRALPDVRDGLKPVHRRILYAMSELGLSPDKPFRKCARICGDVLGKYHPHGDTAVYDALVRMAQDFSIRYPLAEGQGNFGSVDGDGAAAMRYTEARLSRPAMELLADIDKNTVDFGPNFDGTEKQPLVLPCRFPNLLVNGSGGIAVGMATNIPPHNMGEVIDATLALIEDPEATIDTLMQYIPAPDFPTGALILGQMGARHAYRTGRGRIIMRARAEIEPMEDGRRSRIVVTEIPYQVNKARLIEKIAELVHSKKVEGISDIRDESDRQGMRIVVELKRDANPQVVLNTLYKHTQMQETFGVIMLALVDGEPHILNLKEMLMHYLNHQRDVVTRRTRFDLEKAEAEAHIQQGLLIALDYIDEIIKLIRASQNAQEAREGLMERFGLSEKQAQAILDMQLRRLTGLERIRVQERYDALMKDIAYYNSLLSDDKLLMGVVRDELTTIRAKYADARRSEIVPMPDEIDMADLIDEEDVAITLTHFGYLKRLPEETYRAQKRGGKGIAALSTREEDFVTNLFVCSTHQDIFFFTNRGRAFSLKGYEIPEAGRQARGTAAVNLLQLEGDEKITAAFPLPKDVSDAYLVMATRDGVIKKTPLSAFENMRRTGLIALGLREGDELVRVQLTTGENELLIATRSGMSIRFSESDIRPMGRTAAGVRSIDLAQGDAVLDCEVVRPAAQVLVLSERGFGKRTPMEDYRLQSRGGKGILTLQVTDKTGPLAGLKVVDGSEDIMIITNEGTIIRTPVEDVRQSGRNTQGVTMMRLSDTARVVRIALVPHAAEEEESQDSQS
nr:DNA gyrase subunit A [bacterium]